MRRIAVIVAATLAAVPFAHAWGGEGHQIVAAIAERRLTPEARAAVAALLKADGSVPECPGYCRSLSDHGVASWADYIRDQQLRAGTDGWHFIDAPLRHARVDPVADCPAARSCITAQIEVFARVLADRSQSPRARYEALRFLVHFVGDIHQPLHDEDDGDMGGNEVKITSFPKHEAPPWGYSLHWVWDTPCVTDNQGQMSVSDYAAALSAAITPEQAASWGSTDPVDWANEAHGIAQTIYAELHIRPNGMTIPVLPADYPRRHREIVETQLKRAGVRLARLLNSILR